VNPIDVEGAEFESGGEGHVLVEIGRSLAVGDDDASREGGFAGEAIHARMWTEVDVLNE